jgi:hypothetical protein
MGATRGWIVCSIARCFVLNAFIIVDVPGKELLPARVRFFLFALQVLLTVTMPTPAVIAGLVMAAVLGTGVLALGAYTVHCYMNWRCRELVNLFQRNTVRVVKIDDLESQEKSQRTKHNEEKGRHSAAIQQMPQRLQHQQDNVDSQHMMGLRGGFDREGKPQWVQQRQVQLHVPTPAPIHAQSATHCRALGWRQSGSPYEQLWQPPAVFQQVPPQGGWYAYIPPRPDTAPEYGQPLLGQPRPKREVVQQSEQERTRAEIAQQARREQRLDPVTASLLEALSQPIAFEGDSVEVVDEGVTHTRRQDKRKKKCQSLSDKRKRSSSTELATRSSSQSATSAEDVPRDSIPEGGQRRAYFPLQDNGPHQGYAQLIAQATGGVNPYTRQPRRSRSRRKRERDSSVGRGPKWKSNIAGRRQAGTAFTCPCVCLSVIA